MSYHPFHKKFSGEQELQQHVILLLKQALHDLDPSTYQAQFNPQLGFSIGLPSLVSAGLGVLDEANALSPDLENKLKHILLSNQKNGYWVSTYDTAQVIFNTRAMLSKEAASLNNKVRNITVTAKNGISLGKLSAIPGGFLGRFTDFAENTDLSEISLSELGEHDTANATIAVDVPYPMVTAKANGLDVQRSYRRITATGSEALALSQPLKKGDLVISEVTVKRTGQPSVSRSNFVVIEDGIPSLAEGMENDRTYLADAKVQAKEDSYWGNIKETLRYPDRIVRVANLAVGGELHLYQVWRVGHPGNVAIPPATASDMYNEAIQGNSGADRVSASQ
jgi:hypothetical protein